MTSTPDSKVLFITGAGGGIGTAVARHAVRDGWRVAVTDRCFETVQTLAAELGNAALPLPCDVTEWAELDAAVAATLNHFGRLDAALANAGFTAGEARYSEGGPTPHEWRDMILTNVLGTALTARATLPHLLSSTGHLLLLGSVTGRVATPGPYSATKFAVSGMAESIRQEVRESGVRVTCIEPGRVDTAYWDAGGKPEGVDYLQDNDIARAVLYVLSQPPHVAISEVVIRPSTQIE
ncbi:SDR family oxidoreductase [Deinococcus marmoris]|uniref:3-oxoacyl-[acyl-carrier protein] reductase n=1 Tax=Deinococcus marmoris TaxID=249408 RepID=A0A1U7P5A0_9DEIO|nr:SDR family NAD(P)-dependent oxidoreductase [Deinococcus marmoris]OLV20344.1 3-oxoacyl-[acyl-carrier protein] reductase [Deinococcus marmoris]